MPDTILTSILLLVGSWLLHICYRFVKQRRSFNSLPGPPHSLLWGHLKVMGEAAAVFPPGTHPQFYLTWITRKYNLKGIFYLDLWPVADAQVIVLDPDLMNRVDINLSLPMHKMGNDFLSPIIGPDAIAVANGPAWKNSHNAMAPAFSLHHIRNMSTVVAEETEIFRSTLDKLAESGETFSMEQTATKLVFDVISRLTFNYSLNAQTTGSQSLTDLRDMIHFAAQQLSWDPRVKISSWWKRRPVLKRINTTIQQKIDERRDLLTREKVAVDKKNPYSILDLMLREYVKVDEKGEPQQVPQSELDLLLTNIKALLLGGSGTTTDTLCFAYMLLSTHPRVLQNLRDEHTRVFAPTHDATLSILRSHPSKLSDLVYTQAVIREVLRMFPVGFNPRGAHADSTLTHNSTTYPLANYVVITPAHTLHYDPTHYDRPKLFLPERFLEDPSPYLSSPVRPVPSTYFRTFGRGARACLGQNLAMDELKIILLMTVREYEFECVGLKPNERPRAEFTDLDGVFGDVVFQELGIEARPRGDVPMRVRRVVR
ncbi:cytochrome P450 [Elsinoe ampelina]|uniref:Cytochrome P450 n=1 Tax=Elsinoe ampelina TaxID=302913 RepID=A0A6A6GR20_9PEZI|nr:cytochrome P450 [Elsinoe ampelina]